MHAVDTGMIDPNPMQWNPVATAWCRRDVASVRGNDAFVPAGF